MKRICSLLVCLLLVLSLFAGCAPKGSTEVIAARVGDIEITRQQFRIALNRQYTQDTVAGKVFSTADSIKTLQDEVLNRLIQGVLLEQKYAEYGIALTEEEEAAILQSNQDIMTKSVEQFEKKAEEENAEDIPARGAELFLEAVINEGHASIEAYSDYNLHEARQSALSEKLFNSLTQDITLTEAEAKQYFDANVSVDKRKYAVPSESFEEKQYEFESSGGMPPLYVPAGYIRVKHILVEELTLAEELIKRIEGGEDFTALMDEYGTDPGMQREPTRTLGYLLSQSTDFVDEFKEAALQLKAVGDISAPVQSGYGYHIIQLTSQIESMTYAWEDLKDYYMQYKLTDLKTKQLQKIFTEWLRIGKVENYIGRVRDIGMSS